MFGLGEKKTDQEILENAFLGTESSPQVSPPSSDQEILERTFLGKEPESSSIIRRTVGDTAVGLARGVAVGIPETLVGIADIPTLGQAGKAVDTLGEATGVVAPGESVFAKGREAFDQYLSPETRQAQQEVQEAKGFLPTLGAVVENPSTIVQTIADSLPSMLTGSFLVNATRKGLGFAVAKVTPQLMAAAGGKTAIEAGMSAAQIQAIKALKAITTQDIITGAVSEGLVTAGQNLEQVRQQTLDKTLTGEQVGLNLAAGAVTGLIGGASGKFAQYLGLADPQTLAAMLTRGGMPISLAEKETWKQSIVKALQTMAREGFFEEMPQSFQEQVAQNLSLGKPWDEGAYEQAAVGMLTGMAQAGGAHVAQNILTRDPVQQEIEKQISETDTGGQLTVAPMDDIEDLTVNNVEQPVVAPSVLLQPEENSIGVALAALETRIKENSVTLNQLSEIATDERFINTPVSEMAQAEINRRSANTPTASQTPKVELHDIEALKYNNTMISQILGDRGKLEKYAIDQKVPMAEAKRRLENEFKNNNALIQAEAARKEAQNTVATQQNVTTGQQVAPVVAQGKEGVAYTERNEPINFKYGVVDANDLIISHDENGVANPQYPQELQGRGREKVQMTMQVHQIANNLTPERVAESPNVSAGAPIIGNDRVVESGNGRAAGIRLAYNQVPEKATAYKQWLTDNADKFGLAPEEIATMKNPVLVRERTSEVDRKAFAQVANVSDMAAQPAAEIAKADAGLIDDAMIAKIGIDKEGNVLAAGNKGFMTDFLGVIGGNQAVGMLDEVGNPTQDFVNRVQAALFYKAYNDSKLISMMAESTDTDVRTILQALVVASKVFVKINTGENAKDPINPTKDLTDAVHIIRQAREKGWSVEKFLSQQGLFEKPSMEVKKLALAIEARKRSYVRLGTFLKDIGNEAIAEIEYHKGGNLFGEAKKTKEEIINEKTDEQGKGGINQTEDNKESGKENAPRQDRLKTSVARKAPTIEWLGEGETTLDISFKGGPVYVYNVGTKIERNKIKAYLYVKNYSSAAKELAKYEATRELKKELTPEEKEKGSVAVRKLIDTLKTSVKGAKNERINTKTKGRGADRVPEGYERQRRELATNERLIENSSKFHPDLKEGIKKKRLIEDEMALLQAEKKREEAKNADLKKRWQADTSGHYALQDAVLKSNANLLRIDNYIKNLDDLIEPTLTVDSGAIKGNEDAYELGRQNGHEVIFIIDHYRTLNAFINPKTKQIFVTTNGEFSALQLVGHELSHVGIKGHATNLETQKLIDKESPAVKTYWESLNRAAKIQFTESEMLEEYAADLQGDFKQNYDVVLSEGLIKETPLYGMTDLLTNIPKEVDVIARGPTYKEVAKPEVKSAHQQALDLVLNHDTKPMAFGKSIDEYEIATGKKFRFKELTEALDKRFIEVSYDSSKMTNKNAFADFSNNTIYINTKKFKEGDWKEKPTGFHGSEFSGEGIRPNKGESGNALFLTDDAFSAEGFGRYIHEGTIDIQKPFTYDAKGQEWFNIPQGTIIEQAKRGGYDSVIFKNVKDNKYGGPPSNVTAVFDKSQFKTYDILDTTNDKWYLQPSKKPIAGSLADTHLESELAFRGVMALVETAEIGTQDSIKLRNDLKSFKQSLEPFLAQASPEAKRIYGLISKSGDIRNMMGFMTNTDFAGWLESIPDYSNKTKGSSFWSRLKDIVLRYVGKVSTMGRTKLDELSSIMDQYIKTGKFDPWVEGIFGGGNTLAEARRFASPKDYIRAVSFRGTGETTVKGGVEVEVFRNNKGEVRYEPTNLEEAASRGWNLEESRNILRRITEIRYSNPSSENEKGRRDKATLLMLQEKLKRIVQPITTANERLTQIWNTAHGVTAKEIAARKTEELDKLAEQKMMAKPIVSVEEKIGGSKREITLAKEAAGFTITNMKRNFAGERPELPVKKGKVGIEALDEPTLMPLLKRMALSLTGEVKYGEPNVVKGVLVNKIAEMIPSEGNPNYIIQRAQKYAELMDAVEETVANNEKPTFKLESREEQATQEEIRRQEAWVDRTRAWQSGLQVTAPVTPKIAPKADRTEPTNRYILRRNGSEIGSVVMEINRDAIDLLELTLPRKAYLSGVLSNIFRQNPDVQNIKMEINPSANKNARDAMKNLGGLLTTLGGKFNFTLDGKSEYVLNRDDLGTAIDSREVIEPTPEQLLTQPKNAQADFGLVYDYFNSQVLTPLDLADLAEERAAERLIKGIQENITEEFSAEADVDAVFDKEAASDDVVDALFTSFAWHPVNLPRSAKDLESMVKGDWFRNNSNMPEREANKMRNTILNYGGLKYKTMRKLFSLPYQMAQKFIDWARVYKIFGVDRVENRERLSHQWFMLAEPYLNRRHYFKEEGYTRKQMKEAEQRIGRILTIGDENLRNIMFDLKDKISELDKAIKKSGPLFDNSKLEKQKADLEAEVARYQKDRAYSFEEVQEGVEDFDGKKIKLNKLEYQMYRSVRAAEDDIFKETLKHVEGMLFKQYQKQKWYKILTSALGQELDEDSTTKIVAKLQAASTGEIEKITAKGVTIKLKNIFKDIDAQYKQQKDDPGWEKRQEAGGIVDIYEKISQNIGKELKELKNYVVALNPDAQPADVEKAMKELIVAYQRTKPRLKKLRDLRNNWNNWPGFFPRKREQGNFKMQMFENDTTGAIKTKEVYSAMFNSEAEAQRLYGEILEKYGETIDGTRVLPEKYSFEYPLVSKTPEGAFDGMKDFNLQALLDAAFDNMQATGNQYFDAQGKPIDLKGEVWDAAFDAIAGQFQARGAMAHGIHRKQGIGEKAIKGYLEEGHDQILIDHITAMAGVLTKQTAAYDAMEAMSNLEDKTLAPELREYISGQLRNDTALDRASSKIRSFAFLWYLGGMVKSSAVNSTQPIIVGIPMLDNYFRKHGIKKSASGAQLKASADIARNASMLMKDPGSWKNIEGLSTEEQDFIADSIITGSIAAQHIRFIKGQTSGWGRVWNRVFDTMALPFASVEKFNRACSGLAMFREAFEYHMGNRGTKTREEVYRAAKEDAHKFINDVHYPIGKHNLPMLAQGGDIMGIGLKTAYTFRTFTHNFLLNQFNLLQQETTDENGVIRKKTKAEATNDLKTFIHTMALLAMFGGMMGLPFLKDIFDWYEKQFGSSPKEWVRQTLRGWGGETLEVLGMGGIPAILGGNISGSLAIGVPFIGDQTALESIGGVYAGLGKKIKMAGEAGARGDLYRMSANLTPEFLRGPIVALTESDFGKQVIGTRGIATTPQGMPSYASTGEPLSYSKGEALWKGLGFQPTRIAKEREIEQSVKTQVMWANEQKKNISESYRIDKIQNNKDALKKLMADIKELNKRITDRKIPVPRASMSTIIKSSIATKNLQKRRELARRSELAE